MRSEEFVSDMSLEEHVRRAFGSACTLNGTLFRDPGREYVIQLLLSPPTPPEALSVAFLETGMDRPLKIKEASDSALVIPGLFPGWMGRSMDRDFYISVASQGYLELANRFGGDLGRAFEMVGSSVRSYVRTMESMREDMERLAVSRLVIGVE